MKKIVIVLIGIFTLFACNNEKSLQEYLVEKESSTEFITASLPTSLLFQNLDNLTSEQNESLKKIEKINILGLSRSKGSSILDQERIALATILKQPEYQSLLNFSNGSREAKLLYVGTENKIEELIFFGFDSDMGLLLLRMRGNNVKANDIYQITQSAQQLNMAALPGGLGNLLGELSN